MGPSSSNLGDVLHAVVDALDSGVMVLDARHRVRLWNGWLERVTGRAAGEALNAEVLTLFPSLARSRVLAAIDDAIATGAPAVLSHTLNRFAFGLMRPEKRPMVHHTTVRRLDVGGEPLCLVHITDVTLQADRDRFLRERREARYRAVVDTALDAIVTTDTAGTIQWMNHAGERQFGYGMDEAVGMHISTLLGRAADGWLAQQGDTETFEATGRRKDGSELALELSVAHWIAEGGAFVTGILRDVTERKRAQAELGRALDQKSLLLREVNHRVKNSLHLVSSLLSLQRRGVADDAVRHLFQDAIGRIHAIAQVHARLYQTEQFETVELSNYLRALCDDLINASGGVVACDILLDADMVEMPIDQAVPLGLIANELITNAIKHGAGERVVVRVSLKREPDRLAFTVADDGPGLPADFDPRGRRSLGMRIISTLTSQIGGSVEVPPVDRGAIFRVVIPFGEPAGDGAGAVGANAAS